MNNLSSYDCFFYRHLLDLIGNAYVNLALLLSFVVEFSTC